MHLVWQDAYPPAICVGILEIRRVKQSVLGFLSTYVCAQTTDNRQTDIFELTPIHMGNFFFFFFFFAFWRERTNGVKFIPPCLLRKFASLTYSARRGKITVTNIKLKFLTIDSEKDVNY